MSKYLSLNCSQISVHCFSVKHAIISNYATALTYSSNYQLLYASCNFHMTNGDKSKIKTKKEELNTIECFT